MESQHRRDHAWKASLAFDVCACDRAAATRARLIRSLASLNLGGLRAWQLAGSEFGADERASVWFSSHLALR